MAKILKRETAHQMRQNGKSIREIAETLNVSKSTVSYWCRDITLSKEAINVLAERSRSEGIKALLHAAEKKREERVQNTKAALKIGQSDVGSLSDRDIFCVGLGLYWGEGYKRGNEEFGFTNSDPDMILFFIKWLRSVYGIRRSDLILRVSINKNHEHRIRKVEKYWSHITKVPIEQFTKTSLIKTQSKKIYSNHNEHYGTLRIKVRRGAYLRRRILGSISALH